jgi:5-methyltetrahydrofolate--homocysteine methyltransferase
MVVAADPNARRVEPSLTANGRAGDEGSAGLSMEAPRDARIPGMPDPTMRLDSGRLLICDGAMGTELQKAGLPAGGCAESWNVDRPGAVAAVSRAYLDAGAEILTTNTFGGSPARLSAHGLPSSCEEINRAGAAIVRALASNGVLVAGSIGPTGRILEPLGDLSARDALDGFRRQARALAEGGCDLLLVETMTDLREAILAVEAASGTGLPAAACMTFEATPRGIFTIFGDAPSRAARDLESAGASVLGTNCGAGPETMIDVVRALRAETRLPIVAQPNAGMPALVAGRVLYPASPETMARHVAPLVEAGASILGGCCGTTPDHIRAMAAEARRIRGRAGGDARDRYG